jgi:hypothetical protein
MSLAERLATERASDEAHRTAQESSLKALERSNVVAKIADRAGVSKEAWPSFSDAISFAVFIGWSNDRTRDDSLLRDRQLIGQARRAISLLSNVVYDMVNEGGQYDLLITVALQLMTQARAGIGEIHVNDAQLRKAWKARRAAERAGLLVFDPSEWFEMISRIDAAFAWSLGESIPAQVLSTMNCEQDEAPRSVKNMLLTDKKNRPANRPPGSVRDWPFQEFVRDLLRAARRSKVKLGFDRKNGSGRLIETIEDLRPFLPPKFVPSPLPLSTIERVKQDYRKK